MDEQNTRSAPPTSGPYAPPSRHRVPQSKDQVWLAGRIDPNAAPILVTQLDLDDPDRTAIRTGHAGPVMALVWLHRHPLGVVSTRVGAGHDLRAALRKAAARDLAPEIERHQRMDAEPFGRPGRAQAVNGYAGLPACLRTRAAIRADPPRMSVIIGTRERPAELERCLRSLAAVDYPRFEVIVVDNDPETDQTRRVADRAPISVLYLCQRRRGLAAARNLGAKAATGTILAFTDDDVKVDRDWLPALAEAFTDPRVGCVTGLIMPAELGNRTQAMLERRGGYSRGFEPRVFQTGRHTDDPLFPFTAGRMGSGANMAFTASVLKQFDGFDISLGPGTKARAGEDLLALFSTVATGSRLVYQPDAVVWHHHRRNREALAAQAFGYGVGLGAYLTAAVVREPAMLPALLRRLPRGLAYALRNSAPDRDDRSAWPARLAALERRGMLCGPAAYLRGRWQARNQPRWEEQW
ncbi:GT2 family glycosyltransferase [Catenulispora sp. MAP5-51]|uniref:glycosyltransferase n=1 Tax=Catenulispora sp. MAP5-51 TaxID=3156298 RepID=UPI003512F6C7